MKLTSVQSSLVTTPVIEQNEAVFPQPSDQPNITSVAVQPKQLSDLEQELAKIHQKRYNKDQQQPLSTPPVELSNNVPTTGNVAPNTQANPTLPINASQSHAEQVSINISIPTASADSNDNNALNNQTQQAARKISRFQVSVVNEVTPSIQAQPQDSVRTQFIQTTATASIVPSNSSGIDEQRYDYGGMNFQNFANSTGGNGKLALSDEICSNFT